MHLRIFQDNASVKIELTVPQQFLRGDLLNQHHPGESMNTFNFRRRTILIASGALLLSGVAQAQIDEVIVTANKREQTLQAREITDLMNMYITRKASTSY